MSSDIYKLHESAFSNVSAFVVVGMNAGIPERKATIAFRFPRDGAGRLWCYLHVFGGPMVRSYASGYGYDKRSAAASAAASRVEPTAYYDECKPDVERIKAALLPDDGLDWERRLRDAGYQVFQAV